MAPSPAGRSAVALHRRPRAVLAAGTLFLLCACGPSVPAFGGFAFPTAKAGAPPSVVAPHGTLLTPLANGTGAFAPVAVSQGRARVDMLYGSFKFTAADAPWVGADRFEWTKVTDTTADGRFLDEAGAPLVSLAIRTAETGAASLTYKSLKAGQNRLSVAFDCAAGEHFAGFGGQADAVDHRGHTVAAWVSEPGIGKRLEDDAYPELWMLEGTRHASSWPLPSWHSSKGYVGAVNGDRRTVFEVCSTRSDALRIETWSDTLELWLFVATAEKTALHKAATHVLGLPLRPPPSAFAPWNDAIFGPAEVRRVAKVLRDNKIPSSMLWTEDFRGGVEQPPAYRLVEDWDLDRTLYPDAEDLAAELKAQGLGWLAYFNTFLVEQNPVYDVALRDGHFVLNSAGQPYLFSGVTFKQTGLADLSRPQTREWVKSYLRGALDVGFIGWMADFAEWLPHDAVVASGEDPMAAHNHYPRDWVQLNHEVLEERKADGQQRLFFARAGWLRSNEFTSVAWAGDQRTSFARDDGLFTVIPMGINLGLGAVSTYGHDIAGYQSATNPVPSKELFFRWTTLGAASPVMRTHHGTNARQGHRFDTDAETLAHWARWTRFHIQLFPYFDGHSVEAESSGLPLVRGLMLAYPEEDRSWTLDDEYLLGGVLLVAPVHTEGAVSRSVYLPKGEWVSLDDAQRHAGPKDLDVAAALTELPLFLKAGALVPRLPPTVETLLPADPGVVDLDDVSGQRLLWVVPGAAGRFTERDGTTYALELSASATGWAEAGAPLPACTSSGQRGCVEVTGPRAVARLAGAGPLTFPGHTLTVTGPTRTVDVEVLGL